MRLEVIGIHPVDTDEPVHLVELKVTDLSGRLDVSEFTQEVPGQSADNWQVPWDEHFLTLDGKSVLSPSYPEDPPENPEVRVAFFFHFLNVAQPLLTPMGPVAMPPATERPPRLRFMKYEKPC
jgi:hypothetical protein